MSRLQSAAGRVPQRWSFGQWPLRRKLAAAIVLPVLLAFVFGGLRVKNDFDSSRQLSQAADTVLVIRPVVEYNLAVQRLAAAESVGGGGVIAAITKYESAAATLRIATRAAGVPDSVKASAQTAQSLGQAVRTAKTQSGFSDVVIDKSGNTATLMSTAVSDLGLSDDSASAKIVVAVQDTIAAQRAMTGQQLNLANTDDSSATMRAIGQVGAETAALTRLFAASPSEQSGAIRQLLNENGRRALILQQETLDQAQVKGLAPIIEASNTGYTKVLDAQLQSLETNLRQRAADHRSEAILNAAIVLGALALALALVLALIRSLLIPIRIVRQGALDVANKRLPEAVAAMRDGTELPPFEPIPVNTTEEMGQLARAVDDLHTQARTLAGDQARLRVQVGHMFETLSRRSTSLIDQQLSLIERLESDEEDPKQLQSLFRLDHLAARMRRNSDSLLVLAGTSTRRGISGSISVSDAVRAAVSEVENYERIDIGDTSNDHVLGAVGSDLIHLVAEIVDNALSYSPPTSRVAIRGARTPEGGLLIEVADTGLGMPPKDLAALNDQLAHGGDITADTARRMGLFVVGSLAKRHGIAVRLRRNGDSRQGVTVSVHLPAGLLADSARVERPARPAVAPAATASPEAALLAAPPTSAVGGTTKAGLPTRVRGASGATPSPVPGAAKKLLPTRTPGAHGPTAANSIQTPAKPVIEGAAAPVAEKAANGHGVENAVVDGTSDNQQRNGGAGTVEATSAPGAQNEPAVDEAKVDDAPQGADVTKTDDAPTTVDAPQADNAAEVDDAPKADQVAKADDVAEVDDAPRADMAKVDDASKADVAKADDAPKADVAKADVHTVDDAPVVQRSAAGLPVRKPRATGITEYREFEDAPSPAQEVTTDKSGAKSQAPAAKAGRLSWLPGRAKAAAEAARAEAESAEPRQMPSNLSAWLDHRAKVVEAGKAREIGAEATAADGKDAAQTDSSRSSSPSSTDSSTAMHVPEEWVAEAAEATVDAPPSAVAQLASPVDNVEVVQAPVVEQVDATVLPTRVPGATSTPAAQGIAGGPSATRPAMRAHNTSFFGARRARDAAAAEVVAEVVVAHELADDAAQDGTGTSTREVPETVASAEPDSVEPTEEQPAPVVDVPEEPVEQADADGASEPRSGDLNENDTPIFRAMMSRWLTDDSSVPASAAWSTNEADQAWSAAARIEETQPVEESAAGLPMRRPGSNLVPGAVDETDQEPAAPPASRRDPEAIRRNLNRHKNGVSSARTEAQDGTHREEADVHH